MKKTGRFACILGALIVISSVAGSCGTGSNRLPAPTPPRVDVAVATQEDWVLIFYDALNKGPGNIADVVLGSAGSQVESPRGLAIADNRLYVSCLRANRVLIFNDFANLTDGQAPDVVLDSVGSQIVKPNRLCVHENDLYVCCQGNNQVHVFRDVATLASSDVPDLVLDNAGSGIDEPKDACVGGGDLYVANYGNDTVTIYRDVATLGSGDPPDTVLDLADSLIVDPVRLAWHEDTLYVSNHGNSLCGFRSAGNLAGGEFPDFVLGGPSALANPRRAVVSNARLFVPNMDGMAGVIIFGDPATLAHGSLPVARLTNPVESVTALDMAGGALLGCSSNECGVFGYFDADTITDGQPPDRLLWDPRLTTPVAEIDVVVTP